MSIFWSLCAHVGSIEFGVYEISYSVKINWIGRQL